MDLTAQSVRLCSLASSGARSTLDFASIDDHARLPWRFLARQLALLGAATD